jgi:hypothetical protein
VDISANSVGFASVIVLITAYFAAIVYFSVLPYKSRFSSESYQSKAIGFFQQAFYIFSFILFLVPFVSGWNYFLAVLLLYLFIVAPMFINTSLFGHEFNFDQIIDFKKKQESNLSNIRNATSKFLLLGLFPNLRKYIGVALTWIAILGELLFLSYFNPALPFVGWIIILWSFVAATFQAALVQSYLANLSSLKYAKITTLDGTIEGFILSKDSDHYVVKTKQNSILIQNEYVKTVIDEKIPE